MKMQILKLGILSTQGTYIKIRATTIGSSGTSGINHSNVKISEYGWALDIADITITAQRSGGNT